MRVLSGLRPAVALRHAPVLSSAVATALQSADGMQSVLMRAAARATTGKLHSDALLDFCSRVLFEPA
eukprot:3829308-Prymnesium_polylepis.1